MSLKELLLLNVMMLKGICRTLSESLIRLLTGSVPEDVEQTVETIIRSFADSLSLTDTKADLRMGMTHTPFDKQHSLRLFKKTVKPSDAAEAIRQIWLFEGGENEDIPDEEALRLYRYMQPCFIALGIQMSDQDVVDAVHSGVEYNRFERPSRVGGKVEQ